MPILPTRYFLPLIWDDSVSHGHGFAVCLKEELLFACHFVLENFEDLFVYFWLALLYWVSYLFLHLLPQFCVQSFMLFPQTNTIFFQSTLCKYIYFSFSVHHKDWLISSSWPDRFYGLSSNFSIAKYFTQIVKLSYSLNIWL